MSIDSQAEVKPFKVGETLPSNVEGNPEPSNLSSDKWACVETGRRVCIKCNGAIPEHKYSNAKYCSDRCRNAYISYRHCIKKGKFDKPGVGSGGNQEGILNHQYKTGIGTYSKRAFEFYGRLCKRCNGIKNLVVHHINHNRKDNTLQNLEVLCRSCHQRHHETRDEKGKYAKGQSKPLEIVD